MGSGYFRRNRFLPGMLEAVYVDQVASRSIVGIQPKAPFHPLFDLLKNQIDKKIIVFTDKWVDKAQKLVL